MYNPSNAIMVLSGKEKGKNIFVIVIIMCF